MPKKENGVDFFKYTDTLLSDEDIKEVNQLISVTGLVEELTAIRKELKITQTEVAKRMDKDSRQVRRIENLEVIPTEEILRLYANALGYEIQYNLVKRSA